jgi:hypothetical protein
VNEKHPEAYLAETIWWSPIGSHVQAEREVVAAEDEKDGD